MKKMLSVMLCAVLFAAFCATTVTATDTTEHYDEVACGIEIDGEMTCIIRNEYFAIYADNYFEGQFDEYNSSIESWKTDRNDWGETVEMTRSSDGTVKAVKRYADEIRNNEGIWYCTVIFDYHSDFSYERNYELASSLAAGVEVLYAGESTPCAVITVRGATDEIDSMIENDNVLFIEPAFSQVNTYWFTDDIIDIQYKPTASDARKILRYSAGLDGLPEYRSHAKQFLILSDTDLDGKITAADARTALRISAGLETGHHYFHYTGSGWHR